LGLYLNPGNDAFSISVHDDIYIDKTGLIEFTNSRIGKRKRYLCISRPRRFGKSMTAEMLTAYYSRGCDSEDLFKNCKISKSVSFSEHLNQYDVLALNIQQFLSGAENTKNLVSYIQTEVIKELKETYGQYVSENETRLPKALELVYAKRQKQRRGFVFIIDEWDCIFREAVNDKNAQKAYLDFLRDLFKDRTYVAMAYMTGILPIKKYGTHSALNIFDELSMTNPGKCAEYAGFTECEVKGLCKKYKMDFSEAQRWYDGYHLKSIFHIYNPKSVVDAMLEEEFHSYWTSTETYEALKVYIDMNFDGLKDSIINMLGGGRCIIDTGSFQNDMTSFKGKDNVLTLLVHLGYLSYDEESKEAFIPNEEVRGEFVRAVKNGGWEEVAKAIDESERLLDATLKQDENAVAEGIDRVHMENTSILAYNDENSLSCVITLAYYSARKDYFIIRELPSGKGFADVAFIPRKNCDKPAMIVELKWDDLAENAVSQIKDRKYDNVLKEYVGEILLVGIDYDKKTKKHTCIIEKVKNGNKEE